VQGDALQQQLAAVSATEGKLRQELEAAASDAAELRGQVAALQQQVSGLQGEVGKKQAESEAFAQGGLRWLQLQLHGLCFCDTRESALQAMSLQPIGAVHFLIQLTQQWQLQA
jgi:hypothetical protein